MSTAVGMSPVGSVPRLATSHCWKWVPYSPKTLGPVEDPVFCTPDHTQMLMRLVMMGGSSFSGSS